MPKCPMCSKELVHLSRRCPTCKADLDLLVDYTSYLQGGIERAENLTRGGDLGEAIWAYLEVLQIDPDNPEARKQVGKVTTAVRQFDQSTVHFSVHGRDAKGRLLLIIKVLAVLLLLVVTSFTSFCLGYMAGADSNAPTANKSEPDRSREKLGRK